MYTALGKRGAFKSAATRLSSIRSANSATLTLSQSKLLEEAKQQKQHMEALQAANTAKTARSKKQSAADAPSSTSTSAAPVDVAAVRNELLSHGAENASRTREGYDLATLTWDAEHRTNAEHKYCYCGSDRRGVMLFCDVCQQWYHQDKCVRAVPPELALLPGDWAYVFTCGVCGDGRESFGRFQKRWFEINLVALYNVTVLRGESHVAVQAVTKFIERHFDSLAWGQRGESQWRVSAQTARTNRLHRDLYEPLHVELERKWATGTADDQAFLKSVETLTDKDREVAVRKRAFDQLGGSMWHLVDKSDPTLTRDGPKKIIRPYREHKLRPKRLYCICRMPDDGSFMIEVSILLRAFCRAAAHTHFGCLV